MAKFELGDRIARVRKVKETGRIVETLETGKIIKGCMMADGYEHYHVDWDVNDGEPVFRNTHCDLIAVPKYAEKTKYDFIKL